MSRSRALRVALATLAAATLVACAPGALDGDPDRTSSPDPTGTEAPVDPSPSDFQPEPSTPPTTAPVAGALDIPCVEILTPEQVYAFNPEMLATSTPEGGLPEGFARLAEVGGVVCAWQHATSRDVLLVGVTAAEDAPSGRFEADVPVLGDTVGDWFVAVGSIYFEDAEADASRILDEVAGNLS